MKYFLIACFLLFFPFLFASPTYAQENFSTFFDVTYRIEESGNAHVVFAIQLKNTSSHYYVSSYQLQLGFDKIENLHVASTKTPISFETKKKNNGQLIALHFEEAIVGQDKILPFTISFDTPEVTQHEGSVWEVNVPGIANDADFSSFSLHVTTPSSFGTATYTKPSITLGTQTNNTITFTKEQLGQAGISIGYGTTQVYHFNLTYHLANPNLFPVQTEIALPPQTNYQKIALATLNPQPQNVRLDSDGNWIATYFLLPTQRKTIQAKGDAFISLTPETEVLTKQERDLYTKPQPYWEAHSKSITTLAEELKTPHAIYDYVVKQLTYDFSRVNSNQIRLGAEKVLAQPSSAVCLEFADLFIALARAAGIPARELDGYAYTNNTKQRPISLVQDILHAWPEYYDDQKQAWIMVDPTWENSTKGVDYFHTLDFDHVVLAIKGISSTYPVPAGGYKTAQSLYSKDVDFSFSHQTTLPDSLYTLSDTFPTHLIAGTPTQGAITLTNTGSVLIPSQNVQIFSSTLGPTEQQVSFPAIPPLGSVSIPTKFDTPSFLTNTNQIITIRSTQKTVQKTMVIQPFFFEPLIIGGFIFVIFTISLFIFTRRARRLPVSQ